LVSHLQHDITQQPEALRSLIAFYDRGELMARLAGLPAEQAPILTGMGASFHAALAMVPYFHSLNVPAVAVEATDLFYYSRALLQERRPLVFISQSGKSAEVAAIIEDLPAPALLLAVTNDAESLLARRTQVVLPTLAGAESGVATKTYLNCLAVLWLLARRWAGALDDGDCRTLTAIADAIERLLADAEAIAARWLGVLGSAESIVFAGHGPHAATARQAALMLAERARVAAIGTSIGAFRHGPIEIAQPGLGVVLFGPPGSSGDSAGALAAELDSYGARVLIVENGRTRGIAEASDTAQSIDEFLSPMLDVIPAQIFADALARRLGVGPGFRYIGKVGMRL
jgi:glucosamine--fructose-6-phosphate aminotransferase (isomerizing)